MGVITRYYFRRESLDLSQDEYLSLSSFKDWNGRFDLEAQEAYRYMVFTWRWSIVLDLPNTKDRIHGNV